MRDPARSSVTLRRWRAVAPLLLGAACGGPQDLGVAGSTCFRDDECEHGLICVAPEDSINRVCSNDPTPLISEVDGPPPVEMPMGGAAGMAGAMAGGGLGAMAGGGAPSAGSPAAGNSGAGAGGGGAGTAGSGGSGGTGTAGTGGTAAGTAGSGGTDPEGGAPN